MTGFFLLIISSLFQLVDFSAQIKLILCDNALENSNAFLESFDFCESLLKLRIRFLLLALHLQILLNGIRRENDRNNANDVKQCIH